jgi:hypothetical protein
VSEQPDVVSRGERSPSVGIVGRLTRTSTRMRASASGALRGALAGARARSALGWFAPLTVLAVTGVLLVVVADARSRSMTSSSQALFWCGLLLVYLPIVWRLISVGASRKERLGLVVLLGGSLYLAKVFANPFGFTFADELAHAPNANAILHSHGLFSSNAILPVTAYYPGLESVTAAFASMSGLGVFGAGLVVIGAARLLMMAVLFLLFERVSGSDRAAGVGAAAYAANPNFLFFSAQFSYESLALPLLAVVLLAVVEWTRTSAPRSWLLAIIVLLLGIVATHHMSSYALTGALVALTIAHRVVRARRRIRDPARIALMVGFATVGWLLLVANTTVGYLSPVLTKAFESTIHTLAGEAAPRRLFTTTGAYQAPLLERATGFAAVLVLAIGFVLAAPILWRRYRHEPFALVFGIAGLGVFITYTLRFAPAAWETANRASEFLFIGLAFSLGLVTMRSHRIPWSPHARAGIRALCAGCLTVAFAGGVVAGWTPSLRLSLPYRVKIADATVYPEGRMLARWASGNLTPGQRFAASDADARLLNTYGGSFAIAGRNPDVLDVLQTATLPPWEVKLLRAQDIRFVAVDLRKRSFDIESGYFFDVPGETGIDTRLPASAATKFDAIRAARPFDSGDIAVYDFGGGQ